MRKTSHWLSVVLCLLAPAAALAQGAVHDRGVVLRSDHRPAQGERPPAPTARRESYSGPRLGFSEIFASLTTARAVRDFNGFNKRNTTLYGVEAGGHLSLLQWFFINDSSSRLRIADYLRGDFGAGWMTKELSDIAPGLQHDEAGGAGWLNLRLAGGVQASYLVSDDLEVGVVAGKMNSSKSIFQVSDGAGANRWQRFGSVRARYGRLAGEVQTARSPVGDISHQAGSGFGVLNYQRQDFHHALRLRYHRSTGGLLGIDLDRESRRLTQDGKAVVLHGDADHAATSLRLLMGLSL